MDDYFWHLHRRTGFQCSLAKRKAGDSDIGTQSNSFSIVWFLVVTQGCLSQSDAFDIGD